MTQELPALPEPQELPALPGPEEWASVLAMEPNYERRAPLRLDKIKSILGRPPVLSSESIEAYDAMLLNYLNSLQPMDFLGQMLVKDLADADWESLRIKRHKAWAIQSRDEIAREIEARHSVTVESKRIAESKNEKSETEQDKLRHLERKVDGFATDAIKAVDRLKERSRDTELSRAMEETISYYERLDKLEKDSLAKRVIILEQYRLYEETLLLHRQRHPNYVDPNEVNRLKCTIRELRERYGIDR